MAEVQKHGNDFEELMVQSWTGKTKKEMAGYTAIHDIPAGKYISNDIEYIVPINISCKSSCSDQIDCADIKRMYNSTVGDEPLLIIVGICEQVGSHKVYKRIYEFFIEKKHKKILWENITLTDLDEHCAYIASIPKKQTRQQLKESKQRQETDARVKKIYKEKGRGLITINSKVGSTDGGGKDARRVQCSFNLPTMLSSGIPHNVYTDEYRGIPLGFSIKSSARNDQA